LGHILKIMKTLIYSLLFIAISITGCTPTEDSTMEGLFAGGAGTIFDNSADAYIYPMANLSQEDQDKHTEADGTFEHKFSVDLATSGKPFSGLGPLFNHESCSGCHLRNGRAAPPTSATDKSGLLIRLSEDGTDEHGGPKGLTGFGGQLQNFSGKPTIPIEANFTITYLSIQELFPDQEVVILKKPTYILGNKYMEMPANYKTSPRVASLMVGLGLLEAVSETTILDFVDEFDQNKDGISGRPNYGWSPEYNKMMLGRFGWKAAMPSLKEQSAGALNQDMGLTNPVFRSENCEGQTNCINTGVKTDVDLEQLELFTFYCQTVAVPAPRNLKDSSVQRGKATFKKIGCDKCHRPSMKTGNLHPIAALNNQLIFPYTDMLLHDMGNDLSDGRQDFTATGNEWRTPPLWGIGLSLVVNNHIRLMHDGRADGYEEAILWHGGEGAKSKKEYKLLTKSQRVDLINFLKNL
jgi:CxxC motif-containing protein (DUF1111 family)